MMSKLWLVVAWIVVVGTAVTLVACILHIAGWIPLASMAFFVLLLFSIVRVSMHLADIFGPERESPK